MKRAHFIGIGGIGMSGLARILLHNGIPVSGSDLRENALIHQLRDLGAHITLGHQKENVSEEATVIYTGDIAEGNPEIKAAKEKNCPLVHRSELLAKLVNEKQGIAVTGTHGKTTTTSLLATIFTEAGEDPTFVIGGVLPQYQTNAKCGNSSWMIAEADESDGTHIRYFPQAAILLNVDLDHMNHYKTEENLIRSFQTFIAQVQDPDSIVWGGDDPYLQAMQPPGTSYGFSPSCDARIANVSQTGWHSQFDLHYREKLFASIEIPLAGKHNIQNATAAFVLSLNLGLSEEKIRKGLKAFQGVNRRCQKRGSIHGIDFIDDYAHHPCEIRTLLKAVRRAEKERRLVAVFQPHRYSRIAHCFGQFRYLFEEADLLIVTDIYTAGEAPIEGVTTEKIIDELKEHPHCLYISKENLATHLPKHLQRHDVVLTIGAGDITTLPDQWIEELKKTPPKKLRIGLVCGGRSAEHDVSFLSSKNVLKLLSPDHYEPKLFGITREGKWIPGKNTVEETQTQMQEHSSSLKAISHEVLSDLHSCDVVFPVLHGPFGEDGTIQGFFEMLDIPYVGTCHRSSAIAMDKIRSKKLAIYHDIPTLDFLYFGKAEWGHHQETLIEEICKKFTFPCFVKASHLGSSIGIKKVHSESELAEAVEKVFRVDTDLYIEKGVKARELEFAVIGNDYVQVFPPGEILAHGEVYDYKSKYGIEGMKALPKAELSDELVEKGKQFAKKIYEATGCQGMARVDFFLDTDNQYWFNEINPIPGFTDISLFPKGCEVNGLAQDKMVDHLIVLGLHRQRKNRVIRTVNTSEWL